MSNSLPPAPKAIKTKATNATKTQATLLLVHGQLISWHPMRRQSGSALSGLLSCLVLCLAAAVPVVAYLNGEIFWLDVATRLVILAIAAVSLNLVLGFGGLASFGHAAFIGIGAYAVGIPVYHETYGGFDAIAGYSGFWHLTLAIGASAIFALVTGAISLRTRGVHFIMITMAFSQMMFYTLVSLQEYGADDGLSIDLRSELPLLNLDDPLALFGLCFASLLFSLGLSGLLVRSRFGKVLVAAKSNEQRLKSLGVETYRYQLVAYVISGSLCGYAGALMANFTTFISPSMVEWSRSGELIFMVVLGGSAYLFGPVVGTAVFILLEYFLSQITIYWHLPFGIILILVVLFLRGGISGAIAGLFTRRRPQAADKTADGQNS